MRIHRTFSRLPSPLPLILLPLLITGCATLRGGATAELQLGYTVASQRAALAEAAVQTVEDRMEQIDEILRQQGTDRATGLETVEQVGHEVARLRGVMEEVQFDVRSLRADLDQYQVDQERRQLHGEARLRQIEELLGLTPPPVPRLGLDDDAVAEAAESSPTSESTTGSTPEPAPEAAAPLGVEERLALAERRMEEDNQAAARAILDALLSELRGGADPLLPQVLYRRAETFFNDKDWNPAARGFQDVYEDHQASEWAAPALFRIGECFEAQGRADAARTFFEGVVRKYPSTEAARAPKKRL